MAFYLHKDLDGLGAGGSCGPAQNILGQNPEAAVVLSNSAVVLRTARPRQRLHPSRVKHPNTSPRAERSGAEQTYLQECVFTLPVEVKPLLVKRGVVAVAVDPTNRVALVAGTYELALGAVAVGTPSRHTLSAPPASSSTPVCVCVCE